MRYRHREPKKQKPVIIGDKKQVRIDDRTVIEVNVNVPDDIARERFLKRTGLGPKVPDEFMPPKENIVPHEESVGSLEELEAIIEDVTAQED